MGGGGGGGGENHTPGVPAVAVSVGWMAGQHAENT